MGDRGYTIVDEIRRMIMDRERAGREMKFDESFIIRHCDIVCLTGFFMPHPRLCTALQFVGAYRVVPIYLVCAWDSKAPMGEREGKGGRDFSGAANDDDESTRA